MAYDKNTDYQALINDAVARGDYAAAAQAEQSRNQKIADMDASGTNKYGATQTNNYSQYLTGGTTAPNTGAANPNTGAPSQFTGNGTFNGSSQAVNVFTNTQDMIKAQMNANSIAWHTASDAEKERLHAQNVQLAALLGGTVAGGFDPETGYWTGTAANTQQSTPGFSYDAAMPSYSFNQSKPTLDLSSVGDKPTYTSQYGDRIDQLLDQILNREAFSYDPETDPMYLQYKKQYNREGQRAMEDTMDAAAANAGGMNSYAVTAAQQANNYYAAQLTDKIPELFQLARQMYMEDLDNQRADLSMLQGADSIAYNRHRDQVGDYYNERDFAYNQYRDQVSDYYTDQDFAYNQYRDQVGDWKDDRDFQYGAYRDSVSDSQWAEEMQYQQFQDLLDRNYTTSKDSSEEAYNRAMDLLVNGVMPSESVLTAAGISASEAQGLVKRYEQNLYL